MEESEIMEPLRTLGSSERNAWQVNETRADMVRVTRPARPIDFLAPPKAITIDLARTGIIVVDMQNDFCHRDGWLAGIGVDVNPGRRPIEPLAKLLPSLRREGVPVIWLNWGNRPDKLNLSPALLHVYNPTGAGIGLGDPLPKNGAPVLEAGSWAAAIVDELVPDPTDIHVDKYRMSGFVDTPLDSILRNLDLTTLLFAGVNADQCVLATLMDANFHGYDTLLLEDCSATTSPDYCMQATIYNVRQCFGFVTNSRDVIGALPRSSDDSPAK